MTLSTVERQLSKAPSFFAQDALEAAARTRSSLNNAITGLDGIMKAVTGGRFGVIVTERPEIATKIHQADYLNTEDKANQQFANDINEVLNFEIPEVQDASDLSEALSPILINDLYPKAQSLVKVGDEVYKKFADKESEPTVRNPFVHKFQYARLELAKQINGDKQYTLISNMNKERYISVTMNSDSQITSLEARGGSQFHHLNYFRKAHGTHTPNIGHQTRLAHFKKPLEEMV